MMEERIRRLVERTVEGKMFVAPVKTEHRKEDLFLSEMKRSAKRICEYILNQEPLLTEDSCFTGLIKFDGLSAEGDIFHRLGYPHFRALNREFYARPIDNLLTFEWQHSVGDFGTVIQKGLRGIKADIGESRKAYAGEAESLEFLDTQEQFCNTVVAFAHKCSNRARAFAEGVTETGKKANLLRLADALMRVPERPAEGFYEAVLSLYFIYGYIPDSIGLIDRYLFPYYAKDMADGRLTYDEAKAYLQELFLMLQARITCRRIGAR